MLTVPGVAVMVPRVPIASNAVKQKNYLVILKKNIVN